MYGQLSTLFHTLIVQCFYPLQNKEKMESDVFSNNIQISDKNDNLNSLNVLRIYKMLLVALSLYRLARTLQ